MARDETAAWMWSEACDLLARAERMNRQFFQLRAARLQPAAWQPPADVIETASEVLVIVALPGVDADEVQAIIDDGELVIVGRRVLPAELRTAVIHRLELPQGRFERRIPLPGGRYSGVRQRTENGCFVVSLQKAR
jgi:HSP20 family protein